MSTTTPEATTAATPASMPIAPGQLPVWHKALAIGTGFGVAIGEENLEIAVVKARPAGPTNARTTHIAGFRNRPAGEWGSELLKFTEAAGGTGLAATVLLPRSELIVRTLNLPGVADKDVANAIDLQIDTLHPWGDVEVVQAWTRASKSNVLVGIAPKEVLDRYETLFAEAGIPLAALTFSPAVIHAALRIWSAAPAALLCYHAKHEGSTEVYGESEARAVFSAEFPMGRERALSLARAELRLPVGFAAHPLSVALPGGVTAEESALAYAAALAGSAPRAVKFANLLPAARRASHERIQYVVPALLAALVLVALLGVFVIYPAIEQRRYRDELDRAARKLEPAALRAQNIDKTVAAERGRIASLDELKKRPQADLDVLNELTKLLPPPVWTSSIEIYPDSVVIAGEAEQAAPLLKTLDSSPLFQNSEFLLSVTRNAQAEQFRIKTMRRGRTGRTTP